MSELLDAGRLARSRRASGERGERLAARYLEAQGWTVLATRVRVGRDEIDVLAVEPGPPASLVVVEVRTRSSSRYGSPEESVDRRKIARLYRAAAGLRAIGSLPDGRPLPAHSWRVDLVAVDDAPHIGPGSGGPAIRHLRALEPR